LKKHTIKFTREAKKRIEKLDASIKKIIQKAIDSLAQNPYKGKPLSHELAGLYSYRTSDYRIIYKIEEGQLIIIVITVGHRREIYKKLKDWMS
jgi:mRNA interferase RelE/StbE